MALFNNILIRAGKFGLYLTMALCVLSASAALGAEKPSTFEMSLEELLDVNVSSVTRMAGQDLFSSPASVYVITDEDIRRSGHLHIPELLRLAPGLQVSRMDASSWAVSSRGFNNRYNRLQLVQMDGRAITNPLFGGVYWENQDYVIDDLEKIEVISGSGSTLWGANAVNGVISIMTKPAKDTQGWLLKTHTGNKDSGIGTIRYGGKLGEDSYYRVYAKHAEHRELDTYTYNKDHYMPPYHDVYTETKADDVYSYTDGLLRQQVGFRADWENDEDDSFTLQADYFRLTEGSSLAFATYTIIANPLGLEPVGMDSQKEATGYNILGRWNRAINDKSSLQLQMYVDWNAEEFLNPLTLFENKKRVFDIDFQHNIQVGNNHNVVWGLGYRKNSLFIDTNTMTFMTPGNSYHDETISGFFQDTFNIFSKDLKMTLGSKVEENDFTGNEVQPGMRIAWEPNKNNMVWTGVSKAVKVPGLETRANYVVGGATVPANSFGAGNPPIDLWMPFTLMGNSNVAEEEVLSYELGYRVKPNKALSLDFTVFTNRGHHMQRTETVSALPPIAQLISKGVVHYEGLEFSANWILSDKWRLAGGYTWFDATEKSVVPIDVGDETPRNQAQLRSYLDIGKNLELNTELFYKDNIRHVDMRIPKALRLDLGFTWKRPEKGMEWRLWGQNLTDPKHREGAPDRYTSLGAAEVERSFYAEVMWEF